MSIRYFAQVSIEGEPDNVEVKESAFLEILENKDYFIEYKRDTVYQNGVNQVCLTVNTGYMLGIDELSIHDIIKE